MEANRIYIESLDEQTGPKEIRVRYVERSPYVPASNVIDLRSVTPRAPTIHLQRIVQIRRSYSIA